MHPRSPLLEGGYIWCFAQCNPVAAQCLKQFWVNTFCRQHSCRRLYNEVTAVSVVELHFWWTGPAFMPSVSPLVGALSSSAAVGRSKIHCAEHCTARRVSSLCRICILLVNRALACCTASCVQLLLIVCIRACARVTWDNNASGRPSISVGVGKLRIESSDRSWRNITRTLHWII